MSITEIKQALGGWEVRLRENIPTELLAALSFYGHIAVLPGRVDPALYGDNLLKEARYVGVYRGKDSQDEYTLKGSGMAYWLGDEDEKGDVFEAAVNLTGVTFAGAITALLPPGGAVTVGTIYGGVAGTYTGKHQWVTPRAAITYVTDTFGAEWRVNGNGTLDAGLVSSLYVTNPKALLLRKGGGVDLVRKALVGQMAMGVDVEDTTTRVVLLAEGEGDAISTASADALPTPFKDIHGNPIKMTRLVSESGTETTNAAARAQLMLNRFLNPRLSVSLSTSEYDVKGTFAVGDYLDVYDPANGFYDPAREVYWAGERVNPMALRCVEMTWGIPEGWTVAFRDINGKWFDLSAWYAPENGETTIVVGELSRGMSSVGGEPIGIRPALPSAGADFTVPAAPVFGPFSTGSYQPDNGEWTKAAVLATWTQPLNGDGSTITDGGHYEIRYRVNAFIGYGIRWGQLAPYRWGSLSGNRWGAPITDPIASGEWNVVFVPWGQTQIQIQELTPGVEYEFQIRAIDAALPPHQGPWSGSTFVIASGDLFAPSEPAAPEVASSRMAIQVTHTLGRASGGTFNLEPDLAYLSVHVAGSPGFLPSDANLVGKLLANSGMITANVPAVGTFQVEQTDSIWVKVVAVDRSGNHSSPSAAVQSSAVLIDSAHISDLTVSKLTAGTLSAAVLLAGSIKTATTGARVEQDNAGLRAYNTSGMKTFDVKSANGDVDIIGRFEARSDLGASIIIEPVIGGDDPQMRIQASNSFGNRGQISAFSFSGTDTLAISNVDNSADVTDGAFMWLSNNGGQFTLQRIGDLNPLSKVALNTDGVIIASQPSGGSEMYLGVGWPYPGVLYARGKLAGQAVYADTMMFGGQGSVGAGFGALILGYGMTMTGPQVTPVYSISGASPTFYHCLSAFSLSGFTISWSDALAHSYFWRAVRD